MTNAEKLAEEAITNGSEPAKQVLSTAAKFTPLMANAGLGMLSLAASATAATLALQSFKQAWEVAKS